MIGSIEIVANPVLAWEQYSKTFDREMLLLPEISQRDVGGYYSASFQIHPKYTSEAMTGDFLENGRMREVRFYNERGIRIWEGFIGRVIERTGTATSENDLSNVFNRQWTRYNSGGSILRSTKINDTDSQAKIGIKERVIVAGEVSLGIADQHIQQLMDWTSYPSPATRQIDLAGVVLGGQTPAPELEIRCLGYWHTLFWRTYNQTGSSGDLDASQIITAIIADMGEFVGSTNIQDNVSLLEQEADADRMGGEIIESITKVGDGGYNKWVSGFRNNREFYYEQAAKPVR